MSEKNYTTMDVTNATQIREAVGQIESLDVLIIIDQQYAGTRRHGCSGRSQSGSLDAIDP